MIHYLSKVNAKKIQGKTALVRLDFNTQDTWRMEAAVPTLKYLLRLGCKLVVASHKGRPHGEEPKLSLKKDAAALSRFLNRKTVFLKGFDFENLKKKIAADTKTDVFVLENLRFDPAEGEGSPDFALKLASLADFYVNEAFAVSHRADASVALVPKFLPSFAGLLLEKEIAFLSKVMKKPAHPFVVVLGGGKAKDKLGVLAHFKTKADYFLTGGTAANTILKLRGEDVKNSLVEEDPKALVSLAKFARMKKMVVPEDFAVEKGRILDIGPYTAKMYAQIIKSARTILWSGTMGFIEKEKFRAGNAAVAHAIASNRTAFTLTGGGETVMVLKKMKLDKYFSFISTGGGAMLEFLEGKKLPGIEALSK